MYPSFIFFYKYTVFVLSDLKRHIAKKVMRETFMRFSVFLIIKKKLRKGDTCAAARSLKYVFFLNTSSS
jgi:hypothetical protein